MNKVKSHRHCLLKTPFFKKHIVWWKQHHYSQNIFLSTVSSNLGVMRRKPLLPLVFFGHFTKKPCLLFPIHKLPGRKVHAGEARGAILPTFILFQACFWVRMDDIPCITFLHNYKGCCWLFLWSSISGCNLRRTVKFDLPEKNQQFVYLYLTPEFYTSKGSAIFISQKVF